MKKLLSFFLMIITVSPILLINIKKINTNFLNVVKFSKNEINELATCKSIPLYNFTLERKINNLDCNLIVQRSICIQKETKIIQPFSVESNLIAYWKFDDIKVVDSTGNNHNSINLVNPGLGLRGIGSSAFFIDGTYVKVLNSELTTNLKSYSVSFWFFLVNDFFTSSKGNRYCPIFQKGIDDFVTRNFKRSPAIIFDRKEKLLRFYFSTNAGDEEGELIESKSKLLYQRWYNITLIKSNGNVKIFINGLLDSEIVLKGVAIEDYQDIFIGGVKNLKNVCQFPFLIDEFKFYNTDIPRYVVDSENSLQLGGNISDSFKYGCKDCNYSDATKSCNGGYRLCNALELNNGGLQISRTLGWVDWNTEIWSFSSSDNGQKAFALCCKGL